MVILAITGTMCSGKDTMAKFLEQNWGFQRICLDANDPEGNLKGMNQALNDGWRINIVIYPIEKEEQFETMDKRSYFFQVWLDSPSLNRFKRFKEKYSMRIPKDVEYGLKEFLAQDREAYENMCINKQKINHFLFNNQKSVEQFHEYLISQRSMIELPFRPVHETYFMQIAYVLKSRSNCMKKSVGAVLVDKYKRILSTSYNGTPKTMLNCNEGGCQICNEDKSLEMILYKCMCIHAEEGCILEVGVAQARGGSLYTTLFPCVWCCKALVQAGVECIYYAEQGEWDLSLQFLGDLVKYKYVQTREFLL